ncbi:hypothetical protein [Nonomuraea sp. NPDC049695]|uniref:hypothetical protein n=1 Tax=Nonomuraea sp. NPDC049695 TaxID=3154734 RepID=UPI003417F162
MDELGAGHMLMMVSGWSLTGRTRDFAVGLDVCMQPWAVRLSDELMKQMTEGPQLLSGPDDAHTAEKFMDDWLAAIKGLTPLSGNAVHGSSLGGC